jgi:hypothetical protein
MGWNEKFIKMAGVIDQVDAAAGRPITRDYLLNLMKNDKKGYEEFIQYVKKVVMEKIRHGDETIDKAILSKMIKEVVARFLNRTDADVAAAKMEKERKMAELAEKAKAKERENPSAHLDDHQEYVQYGDNDIKKIRDKFPQLPKGIPIATPLIKNPTRGYRGPSTRENDPTIVLKRKANNEICLNHPANGKLCMCDNRIARVCQCIADSRGGECAVVRYVDNGEIDMAILDW